MTFGGGAGWPADGVLRVHRRPLDLPMHSDEPGPSRFDDPRPRTADRFTMRYVARTVRGCLLEILDWMRDDAEAERRIMAIEVEDGAVEPAPEPPGAALEAYLAARQVATLCLSAPVVVSINDARFQAQLDAEPAVRAVLDSDIARTWLLEAGGRRVHLDEAAVRLGGDTGRNITQACALAVYDRDPRPDAIQYASRHDDSEDCWAIFGDVPVELVDSRALDPSRDGPALRDVAQMWRLVVPVAWR